jgi:alpha-beta hydrolase superfamily lysophospholipase
VDYRIHPVSLPNNLEAYLTEQEQLFDDIIPGTEKKIIWAVEPGVRTDMAVVYVHGFSATRQETAPLADLVANRLKANLFYTRLTGHGRSGEAMLKGSVNAWLNDTVEAFEIGKRLGRKVIMMGTSTGGSAVTWMAAQPGTNALSACILISPNFGPADRSTPS